MEYFGIFQDLLWNWKKYFIIIDKQWVWTNEHISKKMMKNCPRNEKKNALVVHYKCVISDGSFFEKLNYHCKKYEM